MQGDYTGAERTDYDDSSWETVGIPHSFSIPYFMSKDFMWGMDGIARVLGCRKMT